MSDTKMKNIPIDYCDLSLWDKYEKLLNKFWRNMLKKKVAFILLRIYINI